MAVKTILLTSGTSWTVPSDYDTSVAATFVAIGAGGGGGNSSGSNGTNSKSGGGGGAFSLGTKTLTVGATVYLSIGAGGQGGQTSNTNGSAGGDTWVNWTSNAAPTTSTDGVLAKGGQGGQTTTTGTGGASGSGVGTTLSSGGDGGLGYATSYRGGGGGGSAASNLGVGRAGGRGFNSALGSGGGGGGGTGGVGGTATTNNGANGGLTYSGAAGGTGGATATAGTNGGGGGGTALINNAGAGGAGTEYYSTSGTAGAGGGGGGSGGGGNTTGRGGNGGLYGGGGGASGASNGTANPGGNGAQGAVLVTYTATSSTYYWVGGTGTWNASNAANWASTSGGAGGAGIPGLVDDVIFNSSSGASATITISGATCRSVTISGTTGMVFTGTGTWSVAGSMSLPSTGLTVSGYTGALTFSSTATGQTITTNGLSLACSINFNGVSGGWALGSSLTCTNASGLTLTNGSLDANLYNITAVSFTTATGTKTLVASNLTLTLTGSGNAWNNAANTGLTLSTGIIYGRIVLTSASAKTFVGGGASYPYDIIQGGYGALSITGANTFRDLYAYNTPSTITLPAGVQTTCVLFSPKGYGYNFQLTLNSSSAGAAAQVYIPSGTPSIYYTVVKDIEVQNVTVTAYASVNNGNNTNITFNTSPLSLYWVGGTATWDAANVNSWSLTSGGSGYFAVPTSLDNVVFDANSGTTFTVTPSTATCRNVTISGVSGMTLTGTGALTVSGSLSFPSSGLTISAYTGTLTFAATTTGFTITSGVNFVCPIVFNGVSGVWSLGSAITCTSATGLGLTNGTLDINGYTLTCVTVAINAGTKSIIFDGSNLVLTGNGTTVWNNANPTGFTTSAGSANGTISLTSASNKTFVGGGSTYAATLSVGGAGNLRVSGNNSFYDLACTTVPGTIRLTAGSTNTFTNFTLFGTAGNLVTLNSLTAGTQATISKASGTVSAYYLLIKDIAATGGATWNAYNSTDNGNNTGWNFIIPSNGNFLMMF